MQRLSRSELASRLRPFAPGDAFWARAIASGEAAIGVGPEALAAWADDGDARDDAAEPTVIRDRSHGRSHATIERVEGRDTGGTPGPLATGDMIDVGERSFVVVAVDRTPAGGATYRIDLVPERDVA
ncbi:hypothetical protein [Halorubrum sp. BV1]|uniref:hypothetical protein n=1 Tax=Halorubrum sp. BV1 TaxID=1498500 RepID=UPI000679C157|nr:hypothetical protein [Halorubrum sp. BV1]